MVVNSFAKMVFNAHQEFSRKWRETHNGDEAHPGYTLVQLFDKYCTEFYDDTFHTNAKKIVPESEYSKEDQSRAKAARALQKQYHEEEDKFVIDYCLAQGACWDDLYKYCANNNLLDILEENVVVCDAEPHQCSFLCKFYSDKEGCIRENI